MRITNKQIENANALVSQIAFSDKTSKKDQKVLLQIMDILDELQIAGGVFKE